MHPRQLGGQMWGVDAGGPPGLRAAAFHGGNLIPVGTDPVALESIAIQLARGPRGCSSIVGGAEAVAAMWPVLGPRWGPARAVRPSQPLLVADCPCAHPADPGVRRVRSADFERFLPAAVAMFTEELGISPMLGDSSGYRARVAELIGAGRSFARFDDRGRVEFKAEIGALSEDTAQIQGVWVRPDLRKRGIGAAATAAVINEALRLAPTASLYVNDFNVAARRMYDRLGMRPAGVLTTILF